jgi:hypothetical protein
MIQKRSLLKINRRSSMEDINGRTPSKNYVKDVSETDKILKFQYLFNALELVTNIDGDDDRKRDNFDKKVSRLSKLNPTNRVWRLFYNMLKHALRKLKKSEDKRKYYERIEKYYLEDFYPFESICKKYYCLHCNDSPDQKLYRLFLMK